MSMKVLRCTGLKTGREHDMGALLATPKETKTKGEKRLDAATCVVLSRCHTNHVEAAFG